jgi:hypothetical protein
MGRALNMRQRLKVLVWWCGAAIWAWSWEFVRSLFYERGSHMLNPLIDSASLDQILHWVPPLIFAGIGFVLFWKMRPVAVPAAQTLESYSPNRSLKPQRMPILQFMKLAEEQGWKISGEHDLEAVDLMDGLRQAGSDGVIQLWRRLKRHGNRIRIQNEVSVPIPREHWRDFEFDWISVLRAKENSETSTYNLNEANTWYHGGYVDICLDREAAVPWLEAGAKAFQGLREKTKPK